MLRGMSTATWVVIALQLYIPGIIQVVVRQDEVRLVQETRLLYIPFQSVTYIINHAPRIKTPHVIPTRFCDFHNTAPLDRLRGLSPRP